ncbi:MAG: CRTAC1 family protein [Phycisphaerales bacterium JB052]
MSRQAVLSSQFLFRVAVGLGAISITPALAQTNLAFTEVTDQAGLADAVRAVSPLSRYSAMHGGGVAGDFNNDGYHDIFVLTGGGAPDLFYINNTDGTFSEQGTQWGVDRTQHSFGASAVDFNNDGYLDIFITAYGDGSFAPAAGEMVLYKNNGPDNDGNWSFSDVAVVSGVNRLFGTTRDGLGSGWGDYDLDGDLDLMVSGYNQSRPCNRLFRNDGPDSGYTFTDVTAEAGIEVIDVPGFIPHLVDMNNDRYPDLILVADAGRSRYFINNTDGTFTDATDTAHGIGTASAMGIDVGDINNDGMLDMYISSITYDFGSSGNVLLVQNHDGSFNDTAGDSGTNAGFWGWGVLMQDFDHDRDLDIAETNGFIGAFGGDPAVLFENMGDGTVFNEVASESGFVHHGQGRGMVRLDIENDGDLDIAIFENVGQLRLYENLLIDNDATANDQSWVRIELNTSANDNLAPQGIGAMISIFSNDQPVVRPMHCGANHASSSPIEVHAGLGGTSVIDVLQVRWADGSYTTRTQVPVNQRLTIDAPATRVDYAPDGVTDVMDIMSYISMYQSNDLGADHNGDLRLNFYDIAAFIQDYINTP